MTATYLPDGTVIVRELTEEEKAENALVQQQNAEHPENSGL